jgi:hypothetical protein
MNNKIIALANEIIADSHDNCEMWDESHKTDKEALDNSHESYWLEYIENGIDEKLFTEAEYYKAFNLAYELVNKGE